VSQYRFKERECRSCVVAKVDLRPDHGLAGLDQCGEMQDAIEGLSLAFGRDEDLLQAAPVFELPLDEFHAFGQEILATVAQIVIDNRLMARFGKQS
jgi:hypothetical protein